MVIQQWLFVLKSFPVNLKVSGLRSGGFNGLGQARLVVLHTNIIGYFNLCCFKNVICLVTEKRKLSVTERV